MESLLKRQPLDDNFSGHPPKSTILSSHNSSSSSSIRSQSPDFSTSLNRALSRNSASSTASSSTGKKAEKQRQVALNKSLEEISRELKEIEECFTVAEEVLRKERERDQQLYNRERQRRFGSRSSTDGSMENEQNDKNESNCNGSENIETSVLAPKIIRKRTPPKVKSPVFKIYSPTNQRHHLKSPTFCNSRLYFRNGKIGCAEAEKARTNVKTTHKIVKQIIEKEFDYPLVQYENVRKVLEARKHNGDDDDDDDFDVQFCKDVESNISKFIDIPMVENAIDIVENVNEKMQSGDKEKEVVGTPIEEEKMSVTEPGSVLNEEFRRLSENDSNNEAIPISVRSSISKINRSPEM